MKKNQYMKWFLTMLLFAFTVVSYSQPLEGWDLEKVRGERYYTTNVYNGEQFLLRGWSEGRLFFNTGEVRDDLKLRFNNYNEDVIVYNPLHSAMIHVDMATLFAFEIEDGLNLRYFKKYSVNSLFRKGSHFFEVLYDGKIDFVSLRQVQLLSTSPYYDVNGHLKNMEFFDTYRYFLVDENEQFEGIGLNKKSILRLFSKDQKKQVKKVVRQNRLAFKDESSIAKAIQIFEENGIEFNLK